MGEVPSALPRRTSRQTAHHVLAILWESFKPSRMRCEGEQEGQVQISCQRTLSKRTARGPPWLHAMGLINASVRRLPRLANRGVEE